MIPFIGPIISGIVALGKTIGGGIVENRKIKSQGKIDISKAKITAKITKLTKEADMDLSAMKGMQFSWKDELLTIWTISVVTACFVPWSQPYIKDGFIFLRDSTPGWFGWCVTGMYAAVFGLRTIKGWKGF